MRIVLLGLLILAAVIAWEKYSFDECKKVGHSTFYCIAK